MSIVAKVYRGDLVDLTHIGHVAVTDYTGKILYHYGNAERVTFARSSAKPLQVIPVLESGAATEYGLTDKEVALMCSSHSGENFHVDAIRSILQKAGLTEKYLKCGTHYPFAKYAAEELRSNGLKPKEVHNNCSGKHSGMLITAKHLGEDLDSYYKADHPLQQRIIKTLAEVCEYDENKIIIAIDGCGVPVHAMPLYKFAQAFAKLSKPEVFGEKRGQVAKRLVDAMIAYPEMVAGTDRFCTDLMKVCGDRLFAKSGAAGFYAIGLKDKGIGMTFKVEDGAKGIVYAMTLEVLRQFDAITPAELHKLEKYYMLQDKNYRGEIVGQTKIENIKIERNI